jgi:pimeloyl-ACP methyl ester carboxylesterase
LAKEREVMAPDLPGYGSLAELPLATAPGLDTRLAGLYGRLDAAPGPVHIIGHSFGGALALRLAAMIPRKVCSVCVYEPTSLEVFAVSGQQQDLAFLAEFRQLAKITSRTGPMVAMETFLDYWMGPDSWQLLDHGARARLAAMAPIVARDFTDALADSGVNGARAIYTGPTRIMFGGATIPSSRRIAELLSEQLPGASLRQLHGLGHMGPLSASGTFNSACRAFIGSVEEGRAASCS